MRMTDLLKPPADHKDYVSALLYDGRVSRGAEDTMDGVFVIYFASPPTNFVFPSHRDEEAGSSSLINLS